MEEKTQEYLKNLRDKLREAGRNKIADAVQTSLSQYYRRHWYEMSLALLEVIEDPLILEQAYDLHDKVLRNIRADISPVAYVKLIYSVVFSTNDSLEKALDIVEGAYASFLGRGATQERYAVDCIRVLLLLSRRPLNANEESTELLATSRSTLYDARKLLEEINAYIGSLQMYETEPLLLLLYYKARGRDYELRKQYTQYYRNAFDVITYSEKAEMPLLPDEMVQLAFRTAVGALLSDEIFNFGKFLNNESLVSTLQGSIQHRWVLKWLQLCNEGNVDEFQQFIDTHTEAISNISHFVVVDLSTLRQKVRLTALLHLAFYTPFNERTFSFQRISKRCIVEEQEVEPLLLSALAHGIVHGHIDGLMKQVHITWVEPRVLVSKELKQLTEHFSRWRTQLLGISSFVSKMVEQIPN